MAGNWWLPRWWLYRPVMQLAHRFNWHWMPPCYPEGDTLLRCSWCGASHLLPKPDPSRAISAHSTEAPHD